MKCLFLYLIIIHFVVPLERTSKMVCLPLVNPLMYTQGKRSDSHNSSPKHKLTFTVVIRFTLHSSRWFIIFFIIQANIRARGLELRRNKTTNIQTDTINKYSPSSLSAMLSLPMLTKASARRLATALLPSLSFHMRSKAFAFSRLKRYSLSSFWTSAAEISSFGPSSRQQVPTSWIISKSCRCVTTQVFGSMTSPVCSKIYSTFSVN